jgi:PST family polysaccharide transporter
MASSFGNSYGQILKSSTLVGGSQIISIALRTIQVKVLAILLGPVGIGLVGLYQSIIDLTSTITGLGIRSSGVRQIAAASATADQQKVARTVLTIRRIAMGLGIVGMILVFFGRNQISRLTFGNTERSNAIAILSVTLLFISISSGQTALVQGMRRIGDLAKLNVLGAFWGAAISIPVIYFWGEKGIAPFLVVVSAMTILTSWWYARKIPILKVNLPLRDIRDEARGLLSLGMVLMASALMTTLVLYMIRVMVVQRFGLEAAGLYQSAAMISNVYIGFILGAMGMDFYPRLTAVSQDNAACNRLVNEQAEIGLLIAAPGLIATLTFAPLVIKLFYSKMFIPAYDILQWQILGTFLRVVSWPLGFTLLAKSKGKMFFCTELGANAVHIVLFWFGIIIFGLKGAGMAFFVLYIFYLFLMMYVIKKLTGFGWSDSNRRLAVIIAPAAGTVFLLPRFFPPSVSMASGTALTIGMGIYSLKKLHGMVGSPNLSAVFKEIKQTFGFTKV